MIALTNRLAMVANMVPKCNLVADIGTDHAYIPIYLLQSGIVNKAIASDIAYGPAMIAKDNIEKYNLSDKIDVEIASGVEKIHNADVVVIAGMGGKMICDILSNGTENLKHTKTLLLQPMTAAYELRHFLHKNGYKIVNEGLAKEDKKIYNAMVVEKGIEKYHDDIHYHIGKTLIDNNHPLLIDYINKKVRAFNIMISNLSKSDESIAKQKMQHIIELKKCYLEVGECKNNVKH